MAKDDMGKNPSNLDKTIRSAIHHDRGWLCRDLTDVHCRALGHVLKVLGMKPLKPQGVATMSPVSLRMAMLRKATRWHVLADDATTSFPVCLRGRIDGRATRREWLPPMPDAKWIVCPDCLVKMTDRRGPEQLKLW